MSSRTTDAMIAGKTWLRLRKEPDVTYDMIRDTIKEVLQECWNEGLCFELHDSQEVEAALCERFNVDYSQMQ